jgi:mRNA-degrading endonuclease RelE of RelBE toxin-antitoxin system
MNYKVKTIPRFERDLKKLVKKYPSLKLEYIELVSHLKDNLIQGTSLGNNCYKIRLSIASKGKGKSGGARVIIYIQITAEIIYLLTIYDKSNIDSISAAELNQLLKFIDDN